jgi:muramoyltetrapeptide carboxypeptidase
MKIVHPPRLSHGDLIGVVSGSAPETLLEPTWFQRGLDVLKAKGYRTVLSTQIQKRNGYLSGSEAAMAQDLLGFLHDPMVKAILFAGGGTNANRMLRHLDLTGFSDYPKIIIGLSNPSTLLNAVHTKTGVVTFHGPALIWNIGNPNGLTNYTSKHFWSLIESPTESFIYEPTPSWFWLKEGKASGRLLGGNLISIQTLLGTSWEPSFDDSIFFWEDISKPINRLDLMLTHFRDAGVFDRISGMVVGNLVNCDPPEGGQTLTEMLLEITDGYSFPILTGVSLGHTDDKITLPIGVRASLDSINNTFHLLEPAVR